MKFPVESALAIREFDPVTGRTTRFRSEPNVITDLGIEAFIASLGGGFGIPSVGSDAYEPRTIIRPNLTPASGAFVGEMRIGQDLAVGVPDPADTGLAGAVAYSGKSYVTPATMSVTYPSLGEVAFHVVIPADQFDGESFTEEGLFTHDGALVARKVIDPPWEKVAGLSIEFTHTLRFSRTSRALPLVGSINVLPDILGALQRQYPLAGFVDVASELDGTLYPHRIWAPGDYVTVGITSPQVGGVIQPRIVAFESSTGHSRSECSDTGPWAGYVSVFTNNASYTIFRINIGAMVNSGGFEFTQDLDIECYAGGVNPVSGTVTLAAQAHGWSEPGASDSISKSLPDWNNSCSAGALSPVGTVTIDPLGNFTVVMNP